MQHEVFPILALERVDDLLILAGSERRHHQRLGFAAGEQRRAMCTRQDSNLGLDRPNRARVAAIDPASAAQHGPADDFLFEILEQLERLRALLLVGVQVRDLRLGRVEPVATVLLALLAIGGIDQRADRIAQPRLDCADFSRFGRQQPRVARAGLGKLDDRLDHRLELAVAECHRAQHDLLGKFLGLGLDHQHALAGAGDDEFELRARQLSQNRVQDIIAVDIAHPRAGDGSEKRYTRDRQGGRSSDHRHDVGIVFEVVAQHRTDDLGFVAESGGEERPERSIDQPRNQSLLFRGTALALEETAGDLAGGKGLFLIVDGQRKKVLTGFGTLHRDGSAEHRRLAIRREHRAVSLAREPAGFEHELAPAPHQLFAINLKHL